MEDLMKNPGFSLIAEEIFLNLNIQELVNCRLVSSFWREFMDGHKSLVLKKLKWTMINRRNRDGKTVVENFPEYQLVLDHFAKREDWDSTRKFFEFMKNRGKSVLAPFHMACWSGDKCLIQTLLKYCSKSSNSFNAPDRHGFTPFHRIVINGDEELLTIFLDYAEEKGIDVNALDKKRNNCLHLACVQTMTILQRNILPDRAKVLSMLLQHPKTKSLNVNARNNEDKTPLHLACEDGNLDVVKLLLSQSVQTDFNVTDAFLLACIKGHTLVVQQLLKVNNSLSNVRDGQENMGLHLACRYGHPSVVRLLLEGTPIDVNIRNHLGQTPLHIACAYGHLDVVKVMIDIAGTKIDICATNVQGYNALHLSCQYGSVDLITTLFKLAKAKEIDLKNITTTHSGQTLLHLVSNYKMSERYESILSLLKEMEKLGILYPEAVNENGNSPLHIACYQKFFTMARYIIQFCKWSKKSLNVTNVNGNTALHIACKNGDIDIVREFMNAYFMTNIDFNAANDKGITPLHLACYFGHNKVVAMLIEKSTELDINLEPRNEEENTPFHMACSRGHLEVVKLLKNKLKTVNLWLKNIDGCTPFHVACSHGQKEVVELLIINAKEQRIDLNTKDNKGRTPFNEVCQVIQTANVSRQECLAEILRILLTFRQDLNIDVNATDDMGNTPIHALLSMKPSSFKRFQIQTILKRLHQSNIQFDAEDANGETPLEPTNEEDNIDVMLRNLDGN